MFAHSIKSPLLAVASLSLALILPPIHCFAQPTNLEEYDNSRNGQSGITSLSTALGILQVGSEACGTRPPLDECEVITLNGKKLFSDRYASIDAVYPSLTNPLLVTVGTDRDGSCA